MRDEYGEQSLEGGKDSEMNGAGRTPCHRAVGSSLNMKCALECGTWRRRFEERYKDGSSGKEDRNVKRTNGKDGTEGKTEALQ